jgi:hypothetical protein
MLKPSTHCASEYGRESRQRREKGRKNLKSKKSKKSTNSDYDGIPSIMKPLTTYVPGMDREPRKRREVVENK